MDRFLLRIRIDYPRPRTSGGSCSNRRGGPSDELDAARRRSLTVADVRALQDAAERVHLVDASWPTTSSRWRARPGARRTSRSASRRAAQLAWRNAARAAALADGRDYVLPDDLKALAGPVLAHRVVRLAPARPLGRSRAGRRARAGGHPRPRPRPGVSRARPASIASNASRSAELSRRPAVRRCRRRARAGGSSSSPSWVGVGAINTGNNLLFLLLGWHGLPRSSRRAPVGAGRCAGCACGACCRRRCSPATPFLMGIVAREPQAAAAVVLDRGRGPRRRTRRSTSGATSSSCPPGARRRRPTGTRSPGAGATGSTGFRLATKFPFGLLQQAREVADPDELVVYPALIPPSAALLRAASPPTRRAAATGAQPARASSPGCASFARATIRATSTGGPARDGGRPRARARATRRPGRRRWSSTTIRPPRARARRVRTGGVRGGGDLAWTCPARLLRRPGDARVPGAGKRGRGARQSPAARAGAGRARGGPPLRSVTASPCASPGGGAARGGGGGAG